jgi:hypothetical protein
MSDPQPDRIICPCEQCRFGLWCSDGTRGQFERGNDACLKCQIPAMQHTTRPRCK